MNSVERLEARRLLAAPSIWHITGDDNAPNAADAIIIEAVPEKPGRLRAILNGRKLGTRRAVTMLGIAIDAGDGNDLVRLRLGAEFADLRTTLRGGAGDDVLIGGATRDTLRGGAGDDRLDGRGNANVLHGKRGADRIHRQPGRDLVRGEDADDRFVGRIRAQMIPAASEPQPEPEPEPVLPPLGELPEPQPLDESPAANVPEAMNRFAFAFYRKLIEAEGNENLLFSPSSLATTLSMLLPAARGETLDQMLAAMRLPADVAEVLRQFEDFMRPVTGSPPYEFANANALWHDPTYPLLDEYRQAVQQAFAAVVDELDLGDRAEAERVVDAWAALHTQGMIDDIVDPDFFTDTMRIVLANAVYFKGKWVETFDPKKTHDAPFHLADGTTVQVPMMTRRGGFRLYSGAGFAMAVLPYEGQRFSMLVLLPERYDGVDELARAVTPELLDEWVAAAGEMSSFVLDFPKFELYTRLDDPIPLFESLGMTNVFSPFVSDLSGMTGQHDGLHLEKLVHAARMEVSEEGTRAAAVSVGGGGICSGPPHFTADRPFIVAIRDDQTGAIQFLGQVMHPS